MAIEQGSAQPEITIIIVNWNTIDYLRSCLQSVFAETQGCTFEVIVVDNGSNDDSAEMVKSEYPQVTLIADHENLGFPAANNQGIRASSGRYILLLNSDTIVLDGAIPKLPRFMKQNPNAGAAGGTLLTRNHTIDQLCFRVRFDTRTVWAEYLFVPTIRKWLKRPKAHTVEVDVLIGAFMMVRREAFQQVGGLDERFFLSAEDVDWTMRIRKAGWKAYFYPDAQIIHFGSESFKRSWDRGIMTGYRSKELLFRKHYRAIDRLALRGAALLGSLIRMAGWRLRARKATGAQKFDALLRAAAYRQVVLYVLRLQSYESSCANLRWYVQNALATVEKPPVAV